MLYLEHEFSVFSNFASLFKERLLIITEIYLSSTYLHINEGIKGSQALTKYILKNIGIFFSPFMRFSHYAVFPRKLKMH